MKNLLLLAVVLLIIGFGYISVEIKGDKNSQFNRTTRYTLGKYPLARRIWNLHNYGDARKQYLSGSEPLILEVVKPAKIEIPEDMLLEIARQIQAALDRSVQVIDTDYIKEGELNEADLAEIVRTKRRHLYPRQPNLFLILAENYQSPEGEIGSTYREYGIVISYRRLQELARNYFSSYGQYLQSTVLHELGHQIGLEHNNESGCVMNAKVNHPDISGYFSGQYTPTEFCQTEMDEIKKLKTLTK